MKYSIYMVLILFLPKMVIAQTMDSIAIDLDMNKYYSKASEAIQYKYLITKENQNDTSYWKPLVGRPFTLSPITSYFSLKELSSFSIPNFSTKSNILFNCEDNFANFIEFKSNPNSQHVIIFAQDSVVNDFELDISLMKDSIAIDEKKNWRKVVMEKMDYKYNNILGSSSKFYIRRDDLKNSYFRFNIVGFDNSFLIKGDNIYYMEYVLKKRLKKRLKKIKQKNLNKIDDLYKLKLTEINVFIKEKYSSSQINFFIKHGYFSNKIQSEDSNLRPCKKKCQKNKASYTMLLKKSLKN